MNKYVPSLVYAAAALTLTTFASSADRSSGNNRNHYVAYQQEDANSIVETESDSEGTYDVFYDRLAPEGRWFYDDDYGYVWQPNVAESTSNWRPYTDGHWVWTDRGWLWDSNEDFGWATYHYGRWVMVAGVGWVWIPGDQWAPAWVSWRQTDDDDYVGWAPLPPEATFSVNVGFHPWCDNYYDIGPAAFAFIRIVDFGRPSYREFCAPPQQNLVLINRTTNVTNITYNNNVIYNNGPQYQRVSQLVQQRTGQQIPAYRVNYAAQTRPNGAFKTAAQGKQLNVIAPPQRLRPIATVQPQVAKQLGKAQVERGWQNVPQGQAQQIRHQFAQQAPVPQTLPPKPVLPNKPQIQALTKGQPPKAETPAPGGSAKVQQGVNGKLQPFIEKPGNKGITEQQKLEQQKLEAQKAQKENGQIRQAENVKSVAHEESPKGKKEVPKKEQPIPPQAKANQHAQYAVAHPQPQYHAQQQVHQPHPPSPSHVAQAPHAQPHPPPQHVAQAPHPHAQPQPHRATSNNGQKQNNGHRKG
jgi:hypothetical protein